MADDLPDMEEPPHPAVRRALTHTLLAQDFEQSAGETGHPGIKRRMRQEADRERDEADRALAEVTGGGDGD